MIIRILRNVFFPMFTGFVVVASSLLHTSVHPAALMVCAVVLLISTRLDLKKNTALGLHIICLGLFHWLSQLNLCYPLYMLTLTRRLYKAKGVFPSVILSIFLTALYTLIRLSYSPHTTDHLIVSFSDLLTSVMIAIFSRIIFDGEEERSKLRIETSRLSTVDPLTGLFNHQEYLRRLQVHVQKQKPFVLYLINCQDFKSKNIELGFDWGNQTLVKIAELLKTTFDEFLFVARSAGDEFALAIDPERTNVSEVHLLLDDHIPLLLGVHMNYGSAAYPAVAATPDELIAVAEARLYEKRREVWLKREEEMFRSEKLRSVGELAAGMAHEIRNPLTTIKGFLQVAKQHDYRIELYYDTLMDEITRMSELTAEFLQFSKPQASQYKPYRLQDCMDRVISLTNSEALRLGHQLMIQKSTEPLWVRMDKDKIVQVLLNLVKNAFEAMEQNGTTAITLSRKSDDLAVIQIKDTGSGIPPSKLDHIFQPFYTSKQNGTGLGLSICQKIIQDHGGSITVESEPDIGTTFTIHLPIVDVMELTDDPVLLPSSP